MYKKLIKIFFILPICFCFILNSFMYASGNMGTSISSMFEKTLFIGDSQTIALYDYKFLPNKNVAAKKGLSLRQALHYKDITYKLNLMKPEKIVILFGHNDINKNSNSATFIKDYKVLLKLVQSICPKSTIYIESVTPVSKKAETKYPFATNSQISQCNKALELMAKENKLNYINISDFIVNSNYMYLEPDGIHLKACFYPLLLNFLSKNIELSKNPKAFMCMAK